MQGRPITKGFISIVNFHAGNLAQFCGQRFLEVSGPGTNSKKYDPKRHPKTCKGFPHHQSAAMRFS